MIVAGRSAGPGGSTVKEQVALLARRKHTRHETLKVIRLRQPAKY
jgi:hypothetical protein